MVVFTVTGVSIPECLSIGATRPCIQDIQQRTTGLEIRRIYMTSYKCSFSPCLQRCEIWLFPVLATVTLSCYREYDRFGYQRRPSPSRDWSSRPIASILRVMTGDMIMAVICTFYQQLAVKCCWIEKPLSCLQCAYPLAITKTSSLFK